jgi:alpha-aminoadipic semialdehyde synthase
VPISSVLNFEGIANRDSYPYGPAYGLPSDIRTLLRGTLRYPGYCDLVQSFKQIGLLNTQSIGGSVTSWADLVPQALATKGITVRPNDHASVQAALSDLVPSARTEALVDALRWLGLLSSSVASDLPPISNTSAAPIDHLATVLTHKLRYGPDERDLVVLSHEIIARPKGAALGTEEEVYTSQLVTYGTSTASAMSRTVGLPVAFAALQILDGKVSVRGVQGP